MSLIDLPDRDAPLTRVLPGDRKIQAALAEIRGLLDEAAEALKSIHVARFEVDPPDNEAVRETVRRLAEVPERLRIVVQDLKTYTDVGPEDHAARMQATRRIAELRKEGERSDYPPP